MKKKLHKRTAEVPPSARLPRISVEVLESRTMLAGHLVEHAHPSVQRAAFETIAIPAPRGVYVTLMPTGSSSLNVVGLASNPSKAWHLDGQGHATITGTVFQISGDGTSTSQDVYISVGATNNSTDSKDNTDDGSGNCPQGQPGSGTSGSGTSGSTTTGGKPTVTPTIARPGVTGPQADPTPVTPIPATQDGGSAQPNIQRPTPPTDPTTVNTPPGPTVTPLAMTPAGANVSPHPASNLMPGGSNIPTVSTVSTSTASPAANLPAAHEPVHGPAFATLAAINPPINFVMSNLPVAAVAGPVQAATASMHVSDIAGDGTAPGTYIFTAAAPSLPARIAYNFVRLDAAAFHDTASVFAAELAAMNVANNDKSHTRAWSITAGVLAVDAALLVYWHRQAKRRKLLQQTAEMPPI